jgi:1-acyl-sn-glycerol-3-phosphate acyltransferase
MRAALLRIRQRFAQRPVLRYCLRKILRSRFAGALWRHSVRMLFGLRLEGLENVPARRPLIFVCNHGSHYDGLFVRTAVWEALGSEPTSVAWGGIRGFPFAHHAIEAGAFSLILTEERGGTTDDWAGVLEQMIAHLRRGQSLVLMGEGMPGRTLRRFKDGAAYAALQTGTPIVPITLRGIQPLWTDLPWPNRWHGNVGVLFHPPVDPAGYRTLPWRKAVDAVTAEVRHRVASAIDYPDELAAPASPADWV